MARKSAAARAAGFEMTQADALAELDSIHHDKEAAKNAEDARYDAEQRQLYMQPKSTARGRLLTAAYHAHVGNIAIINAGARARVLLIVDFLPKDISNVQKLLNGANFAS